eukprot:TRINITY_DN284_c0_g1_i6.p1 TRINITY_DN284_c0_g1~~TRINITY_DN284_c0_g1_i6.p1  ORF type:complete len:215 (-),score=64.44 TRINITY_DN284_c0_g1_i6:259-903(-)
MPARRSGRLTAAVSIAAAVAAAAVNVYNVAFVGSSRSVPLRSSGVARSVGVDYLLRKGPRDADGPSVDTTKSAGATHEVTFKKRPFGVKRYAPGVDGTGAVVMEVAPTSRYPGDPMGQAFVAGVQPGWVVKSINGDSVDGAALEDIMESLDDEVLDPVEALSLNLKEKGVNTDFTDRKSTAATDDKTFKEAEGSFKFGGGNKAELPITVVYQEM